MAIDHRVLDFANVDDLGFAGAKDRLAGLESSTLFTGHLLGPLFEIHHLQRSGTIRQRDPDWLDFGALSGLMVAVAGPDEIWFSSAERRAGLMKLGVSPTPSIRQTSR